MTLKINDSGAPIFIDGRLVPPGTFYNAPEEQFITTDNPSGEMKEGTPGLVIPEYDKITVPTMKEQLTEWEIDFSDHEKDKKSLYDFYVEQLVKRNDDGLSD